MARGWQVQHVFIQPTGKRAEAAKRRCVTLNCNTLGIACCFIQHAIDHVQQACCRLLFTAEEGDHLTLLNVYTGFEKAKYNPGWCHKNYLNSKSMARARDVCRQLRKTLR